MGLLQSFFVVLFCFSFIIRFALHRDLTVTSNYLGINFYEFSYEDGGTLNITADSGDVCCHSHPSSPIILMHHALDVKCLRTVSQCHYFYFVAVRRLE